ncbi:Antimicrobial peptide NK-lysin [Collichthys lucidus]|uniref:Antimicrobial peptide NK-lysin n=1 Tax=Collichthys lucidus TaxID=240159 RepID=A0A4U5VF23_COLLU|nr:Antimicrobial peptide NK-lysin [Collichthys lucidus]
MNTSSVLVVCILVACSVWTVQGRNVKVNNDDQEEAEMSMEKVTSKLKTVCNEIGLLKAKCIKFVNGRFGELVEELTTTDDVRTICVNLKACKPKELLDLDFDNDEDPEMKTTKQPTKRFWTVHGRNLKVNDDDQEGAELDVSVGASRLPGYCWVCKWSLNKVKKRLGRNATVESVKEKLMKVCDEMGLLKSLCRKFMRGHLGVLIEELSTTDDVRTICVNLKACKPKELLELDFESDEDAHTEMNDLLLSLKDLLLE